MENIVFSSSKVWRVNYFKIQSAKSKKTRAGSYIETPELFANKKGSVNIKTGIKCILFGVIDLEMLWYNHT